MSFDAVCLVSPVLLFKMFTADQCRFTFSSRNPLCQRHCFAISRLVSFRIVFTETTHEQVIYDYLRYTTTHDILHTHTRETSRINSVRVISISVTTTLSTV